MILRGVGGETDTVKVRTERKIKPKRRNGRVQIVTEPEDKTYRVSFFKRTPTRFIYPKGTDVLSCNRLLLKNDNLYILSSGSVTIYTRPPFPHFRLIFLSV